MNDRLNVGYVVQKIGGESTPTLAVARMNDSKVRIARTFTGDEAKDVYTKLVTFNNEVSKDVVMEDRLIIGVVFPEDNNAKTVSVGRYVKKSISLINIFQNEEAEAMYELLTGLVERGTMEQEEVKND